MPLGRIIALSSLSLCWQIPRWWVLRHLMERCHLGQHTSRFTRGRSIECNRFCLVKDIKHTFKAPWLLRHNDSFLLLWLFFLNAPPFLSVLIDFWELPVFSSPNHLFHRSSISLPPGFVFLMRQQEQLGKYSFSIRLKARDCDKLSINHVYFIGCHCICLAKATLLAKCATFLLQKSAKWAKIHCKISSIGSNSILMNVQQF